MGIKSYIAKKLLTTLIEMSNKQPIGKSLHLLMQSGPLLAEILDECNDSKMNNKMNMIINLTQLLNSYTSIEEFEKEYGVDLSSIKEFKEFISDSVYQSPIEDDINFKVSRFYRNRGVELNKAKEASSEFSEKWKTLFCISDYFHFITNEHDLNSKIIKFNKNTINYTRPDGKSLLIELFYNLKHNNYDFTDDDHLREKNDSSDGVGGINPYLETDQEISEIINHQEEVINPKSETIGIISGEEYGVILTTLSKLENNYNDLKLRVSDLEKQVPREGFVDIGSMYKVYDDRIELYKMNRLHRIIKNSFIDLGAEQHEHMKNLGLVYYDTGFWLVGKNLNLTGYKTVNTYHNNPVKFDKVLKEYLKKI